MSYTVICDIDGTLFKHHNRLSNVLMTELELLPGVKDQFDAWESVGCTIVLITNRPESLRQKTHELLEKHGLYYHELIMNAKSPRVLINDLDKDGNNTAFAINIKRDEGVENVGRKE